MPVVAAGDITDERGFAAALDFGAQCVQISTAVLACREVATSVEHRQMMFYAEAKNTALTRVFSGRQALGILNRLME